MSMSPCFSKHIVPVRDSRNSITKTCITVDTFNLVGGGMNQAKSRLESDEPFIFARLQIACGLTGNGC